jgi:hypothetical protein
VPSSYSGPDPIHNLATVTSATNDADTANNSASVDTILDAATAALRFFTATPCRLLDTRQPSGPTGGAPLEGGVEHAFTIAGSYAIPSTAQAVVLNVTATDADGQGNLRLWPTGRPMMAPR